MNGSARNLSIGKQKKTAYLKSRDLYQMMMVKLSGTGDESQAFDGMEPWKAVLTSNRRMRSRMSGGVRGGRQPRPPTQLSCFLNLSR